jgi:hypothetical protein
MGLIVAQDSPWDWSEKRGAPHSTIARRASRSHSEPPQGHARGNVALPAQGAVCTRAQTHRVRSAMLPHSGANMPKNTQTETLHAQSLQRTDALKEGLLERQHAVRHAIHNQVRDGRARDTQEGADDLEHSEADIQSDLAWPCLRCNQRRSSRSTPRSLALRRPCMDCVSTASTRLPRLDCARCRLPFAARHARLRAKERTATRVDSRRAVEAPRGSLRWPRPDDTARTPPLTSLPANFFRRPN